MIGTNMDSCIRYDDLILTEKCLKEAGEVLENKLYSMLILYGSAVALR
jgi:hypothetical protein